MDRSETMAEFAAAFAVAQGELKDVVRSSEGYGYNYADLAAVLDIARPVMSKHGLSIIQAPFTPRWGGTEDRGLEVGIETMILHKSGEWVSERIIMPVTIRKQLSEAQVIGMSITYARRYALASFLGIAQADNDASVIDYVTGAELKILKGLISDTNSNAEKICEHCHIDTLDDMTHAHYDQVLSMLQRKAKATPPMKAKTSESTERLKEKGRQAKEKKAETNSKAEGPANEEKI